MSQAHQGLALFALILAVVGFFGARIAVRTNLPGGICILVAGAPFNFALGESLRISGEVASQSQGALYSFIGYVVWAFALSILLRPRKERQVSPIFYDPDEADQH